MCVDSVVNGVIMCTPMMNDIIAFAVDVYVYTLHLQPVFDIPYSNKDEARAQRVCLKVASSYRQLLIRHGSALLLQNVQWLISAQHVVNLLLEQPVQDALGLNMHKLLAAAVDSLLGWTDTE